MRENNGSFIFVSTEDSSDPTTAKMRELEIPEGSEEDTTEAASADCSAGLEGRICHAYTDKHRHRWHHKAAIQLLDSNTDLRRIAILSKERIQ